jgi:hypothetical protein
MTLCSSGLYIQKLGADHIGDDTAGRIKMAKRKRIRRKNGIEGVGGYTSGEAVPFQSVEVHHGFMALCSPAQCEQVQLQVNASGVVEERYDLT